MYSVTISEFRTLLVALYSHGCLTLRPHLITTEQCSVVLLTAAAGESAQPGGVLLQGLVVIVFSKLY